jgi:intein/homing endonuclease
MLPTEKSPPKRDLADLTVLIYGPSKIGKCLKGDTIIVDPLTARPRTIRDIVASQQGSVYTLREAGCIDQVQPSAFVENEPEQLFRLTTQTGRIIEATANHPFLTRSGWKPLSELRECERVAVVAEYPSLFGDTRTDNDLLTILAYLIADGSLDNTSPTFTKCDPEVRLDFEAAVERRGDECIEYENHHGTPQVRVRGKQHSRNNVIAVLKEHGLQGLRAADKYLPDFVFGLIRSKLAHFLNKLFSCDGSMEASGRVSYSSTSIRMVRQVQHLLLRFGIVSLLRIRLLDGELYGAEILISGKNDVLRFIDEIGFTGEKAVKAEAIRAALYNVRAAETQLDRVGPILFDRIKSIEPTTVEPVYDLTIPGTHNFLANDFVVHNSTWCSQAEGAVFLATEAGLNNLEVFQVPITRWEEFLLTCREIAEGKHPFRTVVIDTVDNAYRMCADYICAKFKIDHESDLGFGKGYALINNEFHRVLTKVSLLPYGLFLVSHSQEREIETRTGKHTRIVPTLPDRVRQIVLGMADVILYCDIEVTTGPDGGTTTRRVMRTKPHVNYEAGDRTGRLPEVIDLDFSKFLEAFNQGVSVQASAQQSSDRASSPEHHDKAPTPSKPAAESARPKPASTGR